MRLDRAFVRLPLDADYERLAEEIAAVDESRWRDHPDGEKAAGNTALPIVAFNGDPDDDATKGPMAPTPVLNELPYTRQVVAALGATIGRSRFMRIAEETDLYAHVDVNYYWWHHLRVHVPIMTTPEVAFHVGDEVTNMAPGEVWVFNTWRRHRVENPALASRIHLVIDTVGGADLWDMIDHPEREPRTIEFDPDVTPLIPLETVNHPVVMDPAEVDAIVDELLGEVSDTDAATRLREMLHPFQRSWRDLFARFGAAPQGWNRFAELVQHTNQQISANAPPVMLENNIGFHQALHQLVFGAGLNPDLAPVPRTAGGAPRARGRGRPAVDPVRLAIEGPPRIHEPIFIVSSPRSGSSLLFETLARAPDLYTIGGESHAIIEAIPSFKPEAREWTSNRLEAGDATDGVVAALKDAFVMRLRDRDGARAMVGANRLLEKTPKNALRVPFLAEAFPDARFIYLYRDPRETISSMLDAWRSGRFVTYPDLPGWGGSPWSLLLVPGWEELDGRPLGEVVTEQWAITTSTLLDDLEALGPDRWCVASYDQLVADPLAEITKLCSFLGLRWDDQLEEPLPESRHTLDSPHPEKWRRNAEELAPYAERISVVTKRARDVFAVAPRLEPVEVEPSAARSGANAGATTVGEQRLSTAPSPEELFRSEHTASFLQLLRTLRGSLVVTTYQAGRLILVRANDQGLNTHFRSLRSPMGVAYDGAHLAVGTTSEIVVFQNQPDLARRLDPPDAHDACFVTRRRHNTGDIRVHDLSWADDGLWIVNTRFSCLATLDDEHSFVPRWRPPFITALSPDDRCHLNGLAVVDGQARYASVLGLTDEPNGWREQKAHGGAVIDITNNETIATGLSMPHSPRWYDGRLWILESGLGALCTIEVDTGIVHRIGTVPGFARGLSFAGDYAIIGLSRVREHAFDGLPLTKGRTDELRCGIWVVDITTGETAAYLAFDGLVQEIFEVTLLNRMRYPEMVEPGAPLGDTAYVLPTEALADVPKR